MLFRSPKGVRPATTQGIVFNGLTVMVNGVAPAAADAKAGAKGSPWVLFLTPTIEGAPVDHDVSLPNGKIFPVPNGTPPPRK